MEQYPNTWPKPDKRRPEAVVTRITHQQKLDLYNRNITTRALAKVLNVHPHYLSFKFPHKVKPFDKRPLLEARKAYKLAIATEVVQGKYTPQEGAKIACVSRSTMQRYMDKVRNP